MGWAKPQNPAKVDKTEQNLLFDYKKAY